MNYHFTFYRYNFYSILRTAAHRQIYSNSAKLIKDTTQTLWNFMLHKMSFENQISSLNFN